MSSETKSVITISGSGNTLGLILTVRKAHIQKRAWHLLSEVWSVQKEKLSLGMHCTSEEKKPSASLSLPAESSNGHLDRLAPSDSLGQAGSMLIGSGSKGYLVIITNFQCLQIHSSKCLQIRSTNSSWAGSQIGNQILGKTEMSTMTFTDNF